MFPDQCSIAINQWQWLSLCTVDGRKKNRWQVEVAEEAPTEEKFNSSSRHDDDDDDERAAAYME
jgi:hypothetical protein